MSRLGKFATAAIAIAILATAVGIIAYDHGRDARTQRVVLYELRPRTKAPPVTGSLFGVTVQTRPTRYRLTVAPNTVITLGRRPNCNGFLRWRALDAK